MSLCVHMGIQVGGLFANFVRSSSWGNSPSPFNSKSIQGYVRVGHGPEYHSKP